MSCQTHQFLETKVTELSKTQRSNHCIVLPDLLYDVQRNEGATGFITGKAFFVLVAFKTKYNDLFHCSWSNSITSVIFSDVWAAYFRNTSLPKQKEQVKRQNMGSWAFVHKPSSKLCVKEKRILKVIVMVCIWPYLFAARCKSREGGSKAHSPGLLQG